MTDLNKLLKTLLESKIKFILVGGFAGVVHGSTQVTQDLDICLFLNEEALRNLRIALEKYNPIHRMNPNYKPSFLDEPKSIEGVNNIYLETDIGILDIMTKISGVGDYSEVEKGAIEIEILGNLCKVIGINDLIKTKETMGRAKDKALCLELVEIRKQAQEDI